MADAPPPQPDRNLAIDAVKGIGILQVVVHHALGQGARTFAHKGDEAWTTMRAIAWATNFAIPLFLLLSAMLLAGSLRKQPNVGRFVWRRTTRSLWPYVVWTVLYWALRSRENPGLWQDTSRLGFELLRGKAMYHLYFMVILLQLSLAVPFVVAAVRRVALPFGPLFLLSLVLQGLVFYLNKAAFHWSSPASIVLWYVPSLLVGVWIGLNREAWTEAWRRWWPALTVVGAAGAILFAWMNVEGELGRPWNSFAYNGTSTLFRTSASLALLGAAPWLASLRVGPILAALGRYSLPIYLVHPAILRLLGGPRISHAFGLLPVPVFWTIIVVTIVSYGFAWLMSLARVDFVLFGQSLPRQTKA